VRNGCNRAKEIDFQFDRSKDSSGASVLANAMTIAASAWSLAATSPWLRMPHAPSNGKVCTRAHEVNGRRFGHAILTTQGSCWLCFIASVRGWCGLNGLPSISDCQLFSADSLPPFDLAISYISHTQLPFE
jgi:hypothetical protein